MKLGILCFIDQGNKFVQSSLKNYERTTLNGQAFYRRKNNKDEVFLTILPPCQNNQIEEVAEILIQYFKVETLLNIGYAGSISYEVSPLSIVVGDSFKIDVSKEEQAMSIPGFIEKFKSFYPTVKVGTVVSCDHFVTEVEEKNRIWYEGKNVRCVDLDAAYLSKIANKHQIPYASIKCITDNANNTARKNFNDYEQLATEKLMDLLIHMLEFQLV